MDTFLRVEHLQKYYGSKTKVVKAVDNISFSVDHGEFIGIMGASGSGKTTLLNCLSTVDSVTGGHIYVSNEDVTEISKRKLAKYRSENLGFIFQDFNLLDTLTIEENIVLPLTINQVSSKNSDEKILNVAKQLGITDILDKFPYEVSGGQKQRCACARALIINPKLILADEPTGALDSKASQMFMETIVSINQELKSTILMVTHDAFCASYCQKILFLKDGKIFNEIIKGNKSSKVFFNEILDVLALLGGNLSNVS